MDGHGHIAWERAPRRRCSDGLWAKALLARLSPRCLEWSMAARSFGSPALWFFGIETGRAPALIWTCATDAMGGLAEIGALRIPTSAARAAQALRQAEPMFGEPLPPGLRSLRHWPQSCMALFPNGAFAQAAERLEPEWIPIACGSGWPAHAFALLEAAAISSESPRESDSDGSRRL